MSTRVDSKHNACIVAGIEPLLGELPDAVDVHFRGRNDNGREPFETFVRDVFRRSYGAELRSFYPNLTAFLRDGHVRGVVGYRCAATGALFCEQYLDDPVETVITATIGSAAERRHTVEVGNLALGGFGDARWVIAATTVLLHAAGYRWVVFTAVKPLFNAFQRLGLRPIQIAVPDPGRLIDGGRDWGSYYRSHPMVCAGDIDAGYSKLCTHVSARQPRLHALLHEASRLGRRLRFSGALSGLRAV